MQCPPSQWVAYKVVNEKTLDQIKDHYPNTALSDFQAVNCIGSQKNVSAGQIIYVPFLVRIQGIVFQDTNRDKLQQPGEPPIKFTVTLNDQNGNTISSQTTDAKTGAFEFSGLLPGEYLVLGVPVSSRNQDAAAVQNFGLAPVP